MSIDTKAIVISPYVKNRPIVLLSFVVFVFISVYLFTVSNSVGRRTTCPGKPRVKMKPTFTRTKLTVGSLMITMTMISRKVSRTTSMTTTKAKSRLLASEEL